MPCTRCRVAAIRLDTSYRVLATGNVCVCKLCYCNALELYPVLIGFAAFALYCHAIDGNNKNIIINYVSL